MTISVRDAFRGRHVLVTGTTGFLGKVWLAMALDRLDEVEKFYVLIRKKGIQKGVRRFEKFVNSSPVFKPLHEKYGEALGPLIASRVEVVDGDISKPDFGMAPDVAARLKRDLDLVVNSAGLVDFNPDIRLGMRSNIDGAVHATNFCGESAKCKLVHVSTCYVVGERQGRVAEEIVYGYTPKNIADFDPEEERADLLATTLRIEAEEAATSDEDLHDEIMTAIEQRKLDAKNPTLVKNMTKKVRERRLKRLMRREGERRAALYGWPNSYTYTKSVGEQLMQKLASEQGVEFSVLRPSIVESAQRFPFPGWNEGFNTSGPLVYLLGTWFKHVPAKKKNPFDVVPVDMVCKGMIIAGAALLTGQARQVYQAATSDLNQISISRAIELTALGHRRHLRKHGDGALERLVLSNWDGSVVGLNSPFAMKNVRKTATGLKRLLDAAPKPLKRQAKAAKKSIDKADKGLKQLQRVCEVFQPFIHDNTWVFETHSLKAHDIAEPEFRFLPEEIDWRSYWTSVHMPGLRKWCFPQFEGKAIETYKPKHKFKMATAAAKSAAPVRLRVAG